MKPLLDHKEFHQTKYDSIIESKSKTGFIGEYFVARTFKLFYAVLDNGHYDTFNMGWDLIDKHATRFVEVKTQIRYDMLNMFTIVPTVAQFEKITKKTGATDVIFVEWRYQIGVVYFYILRKGRENNFIEKSGNYGYEITEANFLRFEMKNPPLHLIEELQKQYMTTAKFKVVISRDRF